MPTFATIIPTSGNWEHIGTHWEHVGTHNVYTRNGLTKPLEHMEHVKYNYAEKNKKNINFLKNICFFIKSYKKWKTCVPCVLCVLYACGE